MLLFFSMYFLSIVLNEKYKINHLIFDTDDEEESEDQIQMNEEKQKDKNEEEKDVSAEEFEKLKKRVEILETKYENNKKLEEFEKNERNYFSLILLNLDHKYDYHKSIRTNVSFIFQFSLYF